MLTDIPIRLFNAETKETAIAVHKATCELSNVSADFFKALQTEPSIFGDGYHSMLVGIYFRIICLMESMARLKEPTDFQAIMHSLRCEYELWIDLITLLKEPCLADQFRAYFYVSRFSGAQKLTRLLASHPNEVVSADEIARIHVSDHDNVRQFDDLRRRYWGTDTNGKLITPNRWHKNDLAKRAKDFGTEEEIRYRRLYWDLCRYSHSGLLHVDLHYMTQQLAMGHLFFQEIFIESTEKIALHFGLFEKYPELKSQLDEIDKQNNERLDLIEAKYVALEQAKEKLNKEILNR